MFKVKKAAALVLAGLLAVSTLTGCGGKTDSKASGSGAAAGNSGEEVQLKAYMLGGQQKGLQDVLDKVNAITKKEFNTTIKITFMDFDSYDDKSKLILQSGENCDLMFSANWLHYVTYVGQNAYKPLDDLMAKYGPDIKKAMQDGYFKAATVNGKLYAIPTNKDNAESCGYIINKELADKYKMDFSNFSKPEDIYPFLKTIKEKEPNVIPFLGMHGDNIVSIPQRQYFETDYCANMGIPKDGKTQVINTFDDDRMKSAIAFARKIYTEKLTNADIGTANSITDYEKNKKGFCWIETLKPGKADEMKAQLGYEVIQVNGYGAKSDITQCTGDFTSSMLSIPNASKHETEAMKWINEYFKNKDMQNLLAWGIEGKNYVKQPDGRIKNPDGVDAKSNTYTGIYQWAMGGNQFNDLLFSNEATDKWDKMVKFDSSAIKNPLIGCNIDSSKLQTEIAAMKNAEKQYYYPIENGTVDFAPTWAKYEKVEKAGGWDKLKKAVQDQVDSFLKTNK